MAGISPSLNIFKPVMIRCKRLLSEYFLTTVSKYISIKRPARDACLYLGERGWVRRLPHFLLLIARQSLGGFSSNLAHICSGPGKNV